jgi:hypothetical protein
MVTLTLEETEELELFVSEHSHDFGYEWNEDHQTWCEHQWLNKVKGTPNAYDINGELRGK